MKYIVSGELDVVDLFLHDKGGCGPLSDSFVASAVGKLLSEQLSWHVEVLVPSETGLDRFVLATEGVRYTARCYSEEELKAMLPTPVFDALMLIRDKPLERRAAG